MPSSSLLRTVNFGAFGPIGASRIDVLLFYFLTVFGLIPQRRAKGLMLSYYVVSFDGPPPSLSGGVLRAPFVIVFLGIIVHRVYLGDVLGLRPD